MKNKLLPSVTVLIVVVFAALSSCATEKQEPNVLFIAIDDLNDWVGVMDGHPNALTPTIDSLAGEGILFNNAHTQAPLCGPSRASLMTGLLPTSTGIYLHIDDKDVKGVNEATKAAITLPEYFEKHGYKTMGAGKIWHQNDLANTFQDYGERHEWFGPRPDERIHYDPEQGPNYDGRGGTSTDWGAFPDRDEEVSDYKYASWVIDKLKQEHEKPFFLGLGLVRPHVPWYVPSPWLDMHPLNEVVTPPYKPGDMDDVPQTGQEMSLMPPMPTTEYLKENGQWENMVRAYLASITFADHQVGRVMEALKESPYADNTIIVLFSDHGYHLGEKNRVAKMSLWERDTKIPLIFAGPGIGNGLQSNRPVGLIDIYPTLLDLTKLPANEMNEGRSLKPLIEDVDREWPYPAMTVFGRGNIALRDDRYRYIRYEDGSEEFYDHKHDPNEWHNLARDEQEKERIKPEIERLQKHLPDKIAPLAGESSFGMAPYFRERMPEWREN